MTLSDAELAAAENTPLTPENRPAAAPPPSSRIEAEGRSLYDELTPIGCLYCRQRQAAAEAASAPDHEPAMTCAPLLVGVWSMPAVAATDHPGAEAGTVLEVRCSEHNWWYRVDTRGLASEHARGEHARLAARLVELQTEHDLLTEEHRRLLRAFEETAAASIPGEPVAERRRPDAGAPRVAHGGCFGGGRPPPPSPRCPPPAPKPSWVEEFTRDAIASGVLPKISDFLGVALARHVAGQQEQQRFDRKRKELNRSRKAHVERLRGVIEAMGIGSVPDPSTSFVPVAASTLRALRDIADALDDHDIDDKHIASERARYAAAYAAADMHEGVDLLRKVAVAVGVTGTEPASAAPPPENAPATSQAEDEGGTPSVPPAAPSTPTSGVTPYDNALGALKALDAAQLDKVARLIPSIRKVATPPRITERYVVRHIVDDRVVDRMAGETAGFDSFVDALAHVRTIYPDAVTQPVPRAQLEERGPVPIPVSHVWRSAEHQAAEPDDPIIAINGPIPVVQ